MTDNKEVGGKQKYVLSFKKKKKWEAYFRTLKVESWVLQHWR